MKSKLLPFLLLFVYVSAYTQIGFEEHIFLDDTYAANEAQSVYAVDIDGDGDMDILFASKGDDKIAWFENTDGLGNFGSLQIISTDAEKVSSVYASDLDGDGDIDVLSSFLGYIAWYENTDGQGDFGPEQIITNNVSGISKSVHAADLDDDGDLDILYSSINDEGIGWIENNDGLGNFGTPQDITTNTDLPRSAFATDIDGDGDMDVLSASSQDNKIAWYENTNGQGNFGSQQIITTEATEANSVYATDVDGDGDMDVLSASLDDNKVAWYENTDGQGAFGPQQIITTIAEGATSVFAIDLDGDDNIDVLSASSLDDKIAWYENTDGQGTFGAQQVLTISLTSGASSVYSADLDGDGDMDMLSSSGGNDKIAWYENTDGQGAFGPQQTITTNADGASDVFAIDVDGDNDIDVISTSSYDNKMSWYENIDGLGTFSSEKIIASNIHKQIQYMPPI